MSWSKKTANKVGRLTETYTLPSSATTEYSTVLTEVRPRRDGTEQNVTFVFNASAVSGTNLDIALYGADKSGGTKFLLKDAVVADITATGANAGVVDINAYPASVYYLAWTADANESANTITVDVYLGAN